MKIEKLPSGAYRIRKMYKGKVYTVIFESKPTQKEALQAMSAELDKIQTKAVHMTFMQAAAQYVELKSNILSPKTVKEYTEMPKRLTERFTELSISDITQLEIQREINILSKTKSPKTVRNYHGFISAVLGMFRPELRIVTTLPQKVKKEPYIPSEDDVKRILSHAKGSMFEIPVILACYGLRRSEICALTPEDIEGNIVHINKAKVQDKNNNWVIKTTKTSSSTRDIIIPDEIAGKITEQGYIYKGYPGSISQYLTNTQKQLGIPCFSIHKLRHFFASKMSAMNIPEADILKMGGWQSDYVMKSVYRHALADKEKKTQKEASDKLAASIFS